MDTDNAPEGREASAKASPRTTLAIYARQFGVPEGEVEAHMRRRLGPRMTAQALASAADMWLDDALSLRDRSLIVISALAAQGGVDARLRSHVRLSLEHGVTPEELEAMCHLLITYAGTPRASVAMEIVVEELERAGRSLTRD
jgi:4-carboxymuconolactone decarboxylase